MDQLLSPADRDRVLSAVRAGRIVEAIAVYRQATGATLVQAKNAVEAMAALVSPATGAAAPDSTMPAAAVQGAAPGAVGQVEQDLFAGRKIAAIKAYRQANGCDLRTAKDAVETLAARLYAASPERFASPPSPPTNGWGCLVGLALLWALVVGAYCFVRHHWSL